MKKENSTQKHRLLIDQSWMKFEFTPSNIWIHKKDYLDGITKKTNHHHDFSQMLYCISGKFTHYLDGIKTDCPKGTLAIIPPSSIHAFTVDPGSTILYIDIAYNAFENNLMSNVPLLTALSLFPRTIVSSELSLPEYFYVNSTNDTSESFLFSAEALSSQGRSDKEICLCLEKFFSSLLPITNMQAAHIEKIYNTQISPIISVIDYLNTHYSQKISCDELLHEATLGNTVFYSYFKQFLGITYATYLRMIRVARAHRAIAFTPYSISYIANMCGFNDNAYMTRVYKKYKGYTPTEERIRRNIDNPQLKHLRINHNFFDFSD